MRTRLLTIAFAMLSVFIVQGRTADTAKKIPPKASTRSKKHHNKRARKPRPSFYRSPATRGMQHPGTQRH